MVPTAEISIAAEVEAAKKAIDNLQRKFDHDKGHLETEISEHGNTINSLEQALTEARDCEQAYEDLVEAILDVDRGILTLAEVVHRLTTNGDAG